MAVSIEVRPVTVRPPNSLIRVSYRMERRDYVALTVALSRPPLRRLAYEITGYFAIVALIGLALAGSAGGYLDALAGAFSLPQALLTVPLLAAGPVVLAIRPEINGLVAALIYGRNPMAGRDVAIDLTAEGIEGGASDLYSRIGWAAVIGLIETPTHLFVRISRRQALTIPRRAVPGEDEYRNLRGFIRARTGLST
jgi:hypothetical protein